MTIATIFLLVSLAICAFVIWCAFGMSARDNDDAFADYDWHRCAWCQNRGEVTWFNQRTGVMQCTRPKYAPSVVSHGICPDCDKNLHGGVTESDKSGSDGRISTVAPASALMGAVENNFASGASRNQKTQQAQVVHSDAKRADTGQA